MTVSCPMEMQEVRSNDPLSELCVMMVLVLNQFMNLCFRKSLVQPTTTLMVWELTIITQFLFQLYYEYIGIDPQ